MDRVRLGSPIREVTRNKRYTAHDAHPRSDCIHNEGFVTGSTPIEPITMGQPRSRRSSRFTSRKGQTSGASAIFHRRSRAYQIPNSAASSTPSTPHRTRPAVMGKEHTIRARSEHHLDPVADIRENLRKHPASTWQVFGGSWGLNFAPSFSKLIPIALSNSSRWEESSSFRQGGKKTTDFTNALVSFIWTLWELPFTHPLSDTPICSSPPTRRPQR